MSTERACWLCREAQLTTEFAALVLAWSMAMLLLAMLVLVLLHFYTNALYT